MKYFFKNHLDKGTLTLSDYDKNQLPKYLKDIPMPNLFFSKRAIYRYFFFYSPKNTGTLPHNHGDAFNILTKGSKEWLFYDAKKSTSPGGNKELSKTFKKYPIGSHAKIFFAKELNSLNKRMNDLSICTQEEGDIIYVPRHYAHAVLNKKDVMGIVFETKPLK
ncbi:MAG: hypothetical protein ACI8ZX_001131 [Planctomycetota bacterium]